MSVSEFAHPDVLAYWWLPDYPDRRVPGRLTWDPDRGGDLKLMGELRKPVILDNHLADGGVQKYRVRPNKLERHYPVILGSHKTNAGREEAYTLLNSLSLNSVGFHGLEEFPEHISPGALLHGAWYTDPSEIEADRAIFDLSHLSSWVNLSGLEIEYPQLSGSHVDPFIVITGTDLPAFSTTHENAIVELRQLLRQTGDHEHASGVDQSWQLVIKIEPMGELERFTDIAIDIRALVTIGAGKTADITRAVLQHPQLHQHTLDGTPVPAFRDDITYLNRWAHRGSNDSSIRKHDLYFDLEQLGGADGVRRWLDAASTYRTELRRVMATRYTDAMYLEDRIMNTSAALERFDKVRRPDAPKVFRDGKWHVASFVDRIIACADYAGPTFADLIVEDAPVWAKRVKFVRNQLAHHDDPFRITGEVGEHVLAEQVYWLFVMCLLRECDAPDATFESIARHGQIRWLSEQVEERLSPSESG
ncbi:hypothetical protein [Nocardioides sp. 616]|uniref:ApeA N-terminal domain 1-containing protein n=1 Tax=Nocardioides sp. 616 TaxID=2268090 RepID=UPI0013B435D8|nr:hypothetical protein [Nocardioides sp. 616]